MQLIHHNSRQNKLLRMQTEPVVFPLGDDIVQFIDEMHNLFRDLKSPFGKPAGLSAPQVGCLKQITIIHVPTEAKEKRVEVHDMVPVTLMLNLDYQPIPQEGKYKDWEGCYSISDKLGEVERYYAIHYQYQDVSGEQIEGQAKGFLARLIQHEVDHLQGKLFIDLLDDDARYGSTEAMMRLRNKDML